MSHIHPTVLHTTDHFNVLATALPGPLPIGGGDATPTTAQDGSPAGPGGATQQPQSPFGGQFLFLLVGLMLFMILMSVFQGRKEKKRRAAMLQSIGRHDRVMMSGGIIGTVSELHDDEVVVKVDESTNTRIHFARSAIQSVLKSASGHTSSTDHGAELVDAATS